MVIVVLLLALIALPLTLSKGGFARTELQVAHGDQLAAQALAIAEAGVNHTYAILKTDGNGFDDELNGGGASGGTGGLLASMGIGADQVLEDGRAYRFVAFGGAATDGYFVRLDDNFDDAGATDNPAADSDGKVWVTVRGRISGAERAVKATISRGTPVGIFSTTAAFVTAASTNSFAGGTYAAGTALHHGNVRSNGTIVLSGPGVSVDGNVLAGTTATVIAGSLLTGTATNGAVAQTYPVPAACSPFSSGAGLSGSFLYLPATGALVVGAGGNVTLAGGTYCFGSISISGGGTFTVASPTIIHVTGAIDMSSGQLVNSQSDATKLQINSSSALPIALPTAGNGGYLYLYAPAAPVLTLFPGDVYGAIVADTVTLGGGAAIHVDESIAAGATLTAWHELRN